MADPSLLALMRAEFTVGKRWGQLSLACQLLAVTASLFSAFSDNEQHIWQATVIALFALLLAYLFQLNAGRARSLAEKTRRIVILGEGMGWAIDPRIEANLRLEFDGWAKRLARKNPYLDQGFFSAVGSTGAARLRDYMQESIFFQAQLSKRMANYTLGGLIVMGLLLLGSILFALSEFDQQTSRIAFAKALTTIIPFLVTTNFVRAWWNFYRQAQTLEHLDAQLEQTRKSAQLPTDTEILQLLHEYDIQMLQASQAPDIMYQRHADELTRLWNARAATYSSSTAPIGSPAGGGPDP